MLCDNFYDVDFQLIAGQDSRPMVVAEAKPAKDQMYIDPLFGTCIERLTNHEKEAPTGFARNLYSRVQPFNADDSKILIYSNGGFWHLYDANNLKHLRQLSLGGGSTEPQWHPTNPDILYLFQNTGGMTISTLNISKYASRKGAKIITDFRKLKAIEGYPGIKNLQKVWPNAARIWTKSEGSPSADGRYWGLQVETKDWAPLGLITYDLQTDSIVGLYDFANDGNKIGRPDHVSMSPSGKYIVASWNSPHSNCVDPAHLGTLNEPCGLMSFSRDFSNATGLSVRGPHSDTAIDKNGNDVIVISNYVSGNVEMIDISSGEITILWRIYINSTAISMHISGRNFSKPGWVLISTYGNAEGDQWYEKKLMAVQLKADPTILNLAHSQNLGVNYWTEIHAVVNRDFTKVLFNSNWNSGESDQDAYIINIPSLAIPDSQR